MKRFVNCALVVVSVAFALLLAELGFRVAAYRNDLDRLGALAQTVAMPAPGEDVTLGRIIRLSKNPRIVYELIPNLSVTFRDQPVAINADGFRGDIVPVAKRPDAIRIVGIGDSVMFGWGVKDEEVCLSVLADMLNSGYPEHSWEIVNMAVPGYNTAMEVATLKEKGLAYRPDFVIISFTENDLNLPNFIRAQEDYLALSQSFMIKYFRNTLREISMVRAPRGTDARGFASEPHEVPKPYRDMVGPEAHRAAMEELHALRSSNEFEVIVLSHRSLPNFVKEESAQLGFHTVETAPLWQEYAAEHNLDATTAWQLSKKDPHPSALGHKIIAEGLFRFLEEELLKEELSDPLLSK
ncbi:MAG TPA: SGNH/GDSL hydrolase family protein [Candidatus Hydrogenedentes bacterium]|nr:SGNH/GDSL hydrolase family protein [Candidatus Hydrogenedentota bacterium]HIJ74333.1 SGNH/GDSL hydrolase family protein [Candidatus Hydrogenedentota bacterium]